MSEKKWILNKTEAALKIKRLALEVAEELIDNNLEIVIVGIKRNGVAIAEHIAELLKQHIHQPTTLVSLSLNKITTDSIQLSCDVDFNNKYVLICDDVANSGKTLLYALKPLLNYKPTSIKTLVLVERMHKNFPIKPNFVGLSLTTTIKSNIVVEIEDNQIIGAFIE